MREFTTMSSFKFFIIDKIVCFLNAIKQINLSSKDQTCLPQQLRIKFMILSLKYARFKVKTVNLVFATLSLGKWSPARKLKLLETKTNWIQLMTLDPIMMKRNPISKMITLMKNKEKQHQLEIPFSKVSPKKAYLIRKA